MLEAGGREAAGPQGSAAGRELDAQGSPLFMGGTEAAVPHGSTGGAGLGADPGERSRVVKDGRWEGGEHAKQEEVGHSRRKVG